MNNSSTIDNGLSIERTLGPADQFCKATKVDRPPLVEKQIVTAQVLVGISSVGAGIITSLTAVGLIVNPIGIGICCALGLLTLAGLSFVALTGNRWDVLDTLGIAGGAFIAGSVLTMMIGLLTGGSFVAGNLAMSETCRGILCSIQAFATFPMAIWFSRHTTKG